MVASVIDLILVLREDPKILIPFVHRQFIDDVIQVNFPIGKGNDFENVGNVVLLGNIPHGDPVPKITLMLMIVHRPTDGKKEVMDMFINQEVVDRTVKRIKKSKRMAKSPRQRTVNDDFIQSIKLIYLM